MHCFETTADLDQYQDVPDWVKAVFDSDEDEDGKTEASTAVGSGCEGSPAEPAPRFGRSASASASEDDSASDATAEALAPPRQRGAIACVGPALGRAPLGASAASAAWAAGTLGHAVWAAAPGPRPPVAAVPAMSVPPPPPPRAPRASQAPRREPLPEGGLVDLDEAEGRRRGHLLLAMLREQQTDVAGDPRLHPPAPTPWRLPGADSRQLLLTSAAPFVPMAASSQVPEVCFGFDEAAASHCKGGRRPLGGTAAAAQSDTRRNLAAPEPAPAGGRSWLAVRYSAGDPVQDAESICWDFARSSTCPRGSRCRWPHVPRSAYAVGAEAALC